MPHLKITVTYSHMFGEQILDKLHPELKQEVIHVVEAAEIALASKKSREKTKLGKTVWSGKDFNDPLASELRKKGWTRRKEFFGNAGRYFIDVDFCKGGVALEIQFGKYAFVQHDFSKFRYLFERKGEDAIDVGIEVVPSAALQRKMYTGPANFESVVASLMAHSRNDPAVPIWLIGIDIE